jgi:hypothetical protein
MFMNEYDIDDAIHVLEEQNSPLAPYARYLGSWRDIINDNSDGWPYWKVGHHAANGLSDTLDRALRAYRTGRLDEYPSMDEVRRTLSPIKAAATRNGLPQPYADGL